MPSGKRGPDAWLVLEPTVHTARNREAILFYNSLNGKRFSEDLHTPAGRVARRLTDPANGYSVGLSAKEIKQPDIASLIRKLRTAFMGDLLPAAWSAGKPVNLLPVPYFKSHLTEDLVSRPDAKDYVDYDHYIHEAVIYLNSLSLPAGRELPGAVNQFVFPGSSANPPAILPWKRLEHFLTELICFKITLIQFSGSDLMGYPHLPQISSFLEQTGIPVRFHVRTEHSDLARVSELLKMKHSRLSVHVTFPLSTELFNQVIQGLNDRSLISRTDFHFIVTSMPELEAAREIITATHLSHTFISPYYNGNNFDFFREAVFITDDDIRQSKPTRNQVFSRQTINESDFGKFTLLPDGTLYTNLNDPAAGITGEKPLREFILHEMIKGKSWNRTRMLVDPCRRCLNQFLCPPVSSYELMLKRFNFCDLFDE